MGNFSSELRRYIHSDNQYGLIHLLEKAGEGSPDIINEDYTADCLLESCQRNVYNPVHTAVMMERVKILEILLKYGGDSNVHSREYKHTPLHQAARLNNLKMVTILLKYGADIHAKDNLDRMPIHYAASSLASRIRGNIRVLRHLVKVGRPEDVRARDYYGDTPLHHAVKVEHLKAVKYLIKSGASMEDTNDNGQTPSDVANKIFKPKLNLLP